MKNLFKIFLILLSVIGSSACTRKQADPSYQIPNAWKADSQSLPGESDVEPITPSIDRLLDLGRNTLESEAVSQPGVDEKKNKWKLRGMVWRLGVSAEGVFGLLLGGGAVEFEAVYRRIDDQGKPKEPLPQHDSVSTIDFTDLDQEGEIPPQLDSTIRSLHSKGKIKNEPHLRSQVKVATEKFREMVYAASSVPETMGSFYMHGLQLEVSFDAEGNIVGPVGVGIALGLRLNWVRENPTQTIPIEPKTAFGKKLKTGLSNLVQVLATDLDSVAGIDGSEEVQESGYKLMEIKPAIGISVDADLGIVNASTEWIGILRFHRREVVSAAPKSDLGADRGLPVFVGTQVGANQGPVITVPREPFRKGLKRAMKMAKFFAKRAKKQDSAKWRLDEFSPSFEVSAGGGVGAVSVNGIAGLEMTFAKGE